MLNDNSRHKRRASELCSYPLPQFCILEEESGNVSHVFRKFELEPEQVPYMWKDADIFIEERQTEETMFIRV